MRLKLEEPFRSKWKRAYLRQNDSDGRKRVDLVNSNEDRTTISYARYLKSVEIGYILSNEFEVDHEDGDKTNDALSNLQILTIEDHKIKTLQERAKKETLTLVCANCFTGFERERRQRKESKGYMRSFCSLVCSGKFYSQQRKGNR